MKILLLLALATAPFFLGGCIVEERHSTVRYTDRPAYYGYNGHRYRDDVVYSNGPRYYRSSGPSVVVREREGYRPRQAGVVLY